MPSETTQGSLYRHIKTGTIYRFLAVGVDCTNSRAHTPVVVYCSEDEKNFIYVRETEEFHEKFKPV